MNNRFCLCCGKPIDKENPRLYCDNNCYYKFLNNSNKISKVYKPVVNPVNPVVNPDVDEQRRYAELNRDMPNKEQVKQPIKKCKLSQN